MAGSRSLMARKEMKKRAVDNGGGRSPWEQTAVTRWWSLAAGAEAGRRAVGGGRRERRWTVVVGENPERREGL